MGRKRDAKTGVYLSEEVAAEQDPSTWVEESDTPSTKTILRKIYKQCKSEVTIPHGLLFDGVPIVTLDRLKTLFNENGADIDD